MSNQLSVYSPAGNGYSVQRRRVMKFFITHTGTYNDQFLHPMSVQANESAVNNFIDKAAGSSKISPLALATETTQLIAPSLTAQYAAKIPYGWSSQRLKYNLVLEVTCQLGSVTEIHVTGYTDIADISLQSHHINPDTTFVIDNITVASRYTNYGRTATETKLAAQVLYNPTADGFMQPQGHMDRVYEGAQYSLTPDSVVTQMLVSDTLNGGDTMLGSGMISDNTCRLTQAPTFTSASNNLPTEYTAKLLNAYVGERLRDPNMDGAESPDEFYSNVRTLVSDGKIGDNDFVRFLNRRSSLSLGFSNVLGVGCNTFRLADLQEYDPTFIPIPGPGSVFQFVSSSMGGLHQAGMTASWNTTGPETQFAVILADGIPAIMMSCGVTYLRFSASNRVDLEGNIHITFQRCVTLSEVGEAAAKTTLHHRLENEILRMASFNNAMGFSVDFGCLLQGDTVLTISLEGGPKYDYNRPTFCGSLISPMVSNDGATLNSLQEQISSIGDTLWHAKRSAAVGGNSFSIGPAGAFGPGLAAPPQPTYRAPMNDVVVKPISNVPDIWSNPV